MLNRKAVAFFVLMLLAFDFSYSLLSTCQPIREGAAHYGGEQNHCSPFAGVLFEFGIFPFAEWLKAYEHELIAGFTIVLAFSTIGLWWSTSRLWTESKLQREENKITADRQFEVTQKSIDLARDEFIATHRPKIIIHAIEFRRNPVGIKADDADDQLGASLLCFNTGESTAKKVEVRATIMSGSNFALDVQRPLIKSFSDVVSGEKLRAEIKSDYLVREIGIRQGTAVSNFSCIGTICYWDEMGYRRETGFCFHTVLNPTGYRWAPSRISEHEYAY